MSIGLINELAQWLVLLALLFLMLGASSLIGKLGKRCDYLLTTLLKHNEMLGKMTWAIQSLNNRTARLVEDEVQH